MAHGETIRLVLTIAGLVFMCFTLAIIFLGKRVGDAQGKNQIIRFANFQVETNAALTLFIISAAFTLLPFALPFIRPEVPLEYGDFVIGGVVELEDGAPPQGVLVTVVRLRSGVEEPLPPTVVDEAGLFLVTVPEAQPQERFRITLSKSGYIEKSLDVGLDRVTAPFRLSRIDGRS